jgi:translation initiation factor 1
VPTKTASDGIIRLSLDTKGRKGKGVTLITGFDASSDELKAIAKRLKALCSSGGTIKNGAIEIQGDHRAVLKASLADEYTVKLSGS